MSDNNPLVSIHCLVYNHEPYLRQCLDGFVMQKTNFPFEAIVHDDCSPDGSAAIIREYAEKYPDIIKPIYETENQYSKGDGSLDRIMREAISPSSKYIAICEGDDYWTDPLKLQRQVDYMEVHPDYSMCFHTVEIKRDGRIIGNDRHSDVDRVYSTKKIIEAGGGFCATCSLLFRREYNEELPEFRRIAPIGDYPLQILLALKGKIFYFTKEMGVYRSGHAGSWTANQNKELYRALLDLKLKWMGAVLDYTSGDYKDSVHYSCLCSMIRRYDEGVIPFGNVKEYIKKSRINVFHLDPSSRTFYLFMYVKFVFPRFYRLSQKLIWK